MSVLDLFAKLTLNTSEYEKGLNDAESKAGSAGNKIASGLSMVAKVGVAAFGAVTTAVGALATSAVSSYARYEQLVGGVTKLYGDASDKLQAYADKAYLTAGMSANAYMETATGFSAALVNSLGGDVNRAADLTDVAMRAMSDNVNTFGSSMDSVKFAFQGFAKQNYTMLDNLKLGYGGTKSEMERLIKDANEWGAANGKASDLSIESFADVVTAIQQIQEKQGIAGTTSLEAMKTLEGSANATKAAWENVITAIGRGEGIGDAINSLTGAIFGEKEGEGLLNQIIPRIQKTFEGIANLVTTAGPMIAEKIPDIAEAIIPSLLETAVGVFVTLSSAIPGLAKSVIDSIISVAETMVSEFSNAFLGYDITSNMTTFMASIAIIIGDKIPEVTDKAFDMMSGFAENLLESAPGVIEVIGGIMEMVVYGLTEAIPRFLDKGTEFIENLSLGVEQNGPTIIATIGTVLTNMITRIMQAAPSILTSAVNLMMALARGIVSNIPTILGSIGQVLVRLILAIVQNYPKLLQTGLELMGKMAAGIIQGLPKIIANIFKINSNVKKSFTSFNWAGIGTQIINGVSNGIRNGASKIANAAKNAAKSAFDAAKNFLGIKSPSKLFRDKIGAMMAKGMEIGFEQEFDPDDYEDVIGGISDIGRDYSSDINGSTVTIDKSDDYTAVVNAIESIKTALYSMQIIMDSGELVGALADPMNSALGRKAVLAGRS